MKTAFLLAGFNIHHTATHEEYKPLKEGLEQKGYKVIPVDISWRRKTMTEYAAEFRKFYKKHKSEENILIGNSFGAMVSFITISGLQPDAVYLCSLSPFFREDKGLKKEYSDLFWKRLFGKRRLEEAWQLSFNDICKEVNKAKTKVFAIYGEKEHKTSPMLVARANKVEKKIKNSQLIEVPNAPHHLGDSTYMDAVIELL